MDMENFVLIASLSSFVLTTVLSGAIVALCLFYCKVYHLKNKSKADCSAKDIEVPEENIINSSKSSHQFHTDPNLCQQQYNNPAYYITPHHEARKNSFPCPPLSHKGLTSSSSGMRSDSGYGDSFACSMNSSSGYSRNYLNTVQGYSDDLAARLSFASSACSSNGAYYYSGMEGKTCSYENIIPCQGFDPENCSEFQQIAPKSFRTPTKNGAAYLHMHGDHLPVLAAIHKYATPGKAAIHYIPEEVDIENMAVSP